MTDQNKCPNCQVEPYSSHDGSRGWCDACLAAGPPVAAKPKKRRVKGPDGKFVKRTEG